MGRVYVTHRGEEEGIRAGRQGEESGCVDRVSEVTSHGERDH